MTSVLGIKMSSWNCRGLQKLKKVKQVMGRLKDMQSQIIFLQETHLAGKEDLKIKRRWRGEVFSAPFTSQARGVLTLVHKSVPLKVHKVIADRMGRYLIVQGTLFTEPLNLVNVYAPNKDEPGFFSNLFCTLASLTGHYILAGDFNCTLNPNIDKSSHLDKSHSWSRETILQFARELNLKDIWRDRNPGVSTYSCFSSTHNSYSRIDYFLISASLCYKVKGCDYGSILISDHAPANLVYMDPGLVRDPPKWKFKQEWLKDKDLMEYLEKQITDYFELNTSETSSCIRWEAFKAFIRGHIINFTSSKSKKAKQKLLILESKIKATENIYFQNPCPKLHQSLILLRAQYNEISASKATANLLKLKQSVFDQGEKSGKILAWRIKQIQLEQSITVLKNDRGETISDPTAINDSFRVYYERLYSSEVARDELDPNFFSF